MDAPILEIRNLSISFSKKRRTISVVHQLSLSIARGETLCLVGESGSGKSVTAQSIVRLLPTPPARVDGGEICYQGTDLLKIGMRQLRRIRGSEIAMVFQEPMTSLNPVFRVGDQIAEMFQIHHHQSHKEAKKLSLELMESVAISGNRYQDYPHQLSGGMQQRVMIAMALTCRPRLLIADEPTTALDTTVAGQVLTLFKRLTRSLDMSMFFISHDLGVVAEMADHVAVMYAGVIMEKAHVNVLFSNPLHPYTRGLFRSIPRPSAKLEPIPGRFRALEENESYCRFYDRCVNATAECKNGEPPLRELESGHFVRCINI